MPITFRASGDEGWTEITVSGRLRDAEIRTVFPLLSAAIKRHGSLRIVEVIAGFEGYDFGALQTMLDSNGDALSKITHSAVVCDFGWMGPVTRAAGLVAPLIVRSFLTHDRDAARAWIANPDPLSQSTPQPGAPLPVAS